MNVNNSCLVHFSVAKYPKVFVFGKRKVMQKVIFAMVCSWIDWVCSCNLVAGLSTSLVLKKSKGMFYGVFVEAEVNASCICK